MVTDASNATFAAIDPLAQTACVEVAATEPPEGLWHSRFHYADGVAGHVAAHQAPLCVPDAAASALFRRLGSRPIGAVAAVPVRAGQALAGVLTVTAATPHAFGPAAVDQLAGVATAFAAPLATAQQAAVLGRLAELAHDLHTPVAALRCLVAQQTASPLGELAELATAQVAALAEEMDDVLRLADDRLVLQPVPTDPATLARTVVAALVPLAREADIRLAVEAAPGLPLVLADRARLCRLLTNLVANALKYAPAGTAVTLSAKADGAAVAFAVTDRGPGLGAGTAPRELRGGGGHGLGLGIADHLARAHGGTLKLVSRPGGGTRAIVRLPAHAPSVPVAAPVPIRAAAPLLAAVPA